MNGYGFVKCRYERALSWMRVFEGKGRVSHDIHDLTPDEQLRLEMIRGFETLRRSALILMTSREETES